MDEQTKAAFASASDTSKQLITLGTGVLALEITFAKEVVGTLNPAAKSLLGFSWIFLFLSVVAGVWTLLALTGSLGRAAPLRPSEISGSNIRIPAVLQILLFLVGLVLTICFGFRAVGW